jgi:hypothetical protein
MAELNYLNSVPLGGFNYDNCIRNTALETATNTTHKTSYTKTGTTICGLIFNVSVHATEDWPISQICFFRAELYSLPTPEPLLAQLWLTRTALSSTTWPPTFTPLVLAQPPTAITSLVSINLIKSQVQAGYLQKRS